MVLIRVLASRSHYNRWVRKDLDPYRRMKDTFGYDASPISVYRVDVGIDEAQTIAAHYLTLKRNYIERAWALRIKLEDLTDLGIGVIENPGDTGVAEADTKHRDLTGSTQQFAMLTARLYEAIRRGEDRLRVLEEVQIEYLLQEFLRLDTNVVNARAKTACRKALRV